MRKYQEDFLEFGFTATRINNQDRPLCLVCGEQLANESLKPVKLKRHLDSKHPTVAGKPLPYFQRLLAQSATQKSGFEKRLSVPVKALRASLEVSCLIAKDKKPHTIGETLLLPAAIKMVEIMLDKTKAECLKNIPLSNNTVKRRIDVCAENLKSQLIVAVKASPSFGIQLDESTDVDSIANLLCFVRYQRNGKFEEEMLFCAGIEGNAKAADIFSITDKFFTTHTLSWSKCEAVCVDGAPVMLGCKSGFKALVLQANPNIRVTHCLIHREVLAGQDVGSDLQEVAQILVKMVNVVKAHPLQTRLFRLLCDEMGADYENLLFYSGARWLSRGKVIRRVLILREELRTFLYERSNSYAEYWQDKEWVIKVAYLGDIIEKLNELNLSLQGRNTFLLTLSDKITGFQGKLALWQRRIQGGCFDMFSTVKEMLEELNVTDTSKLTETISDHLTKLASKLEERFGGLPGDEQDWIRNPARVEEWDMPLKHLEELSDLRRDRTAMLAFQSLPLDEFWISMAKDYPAVSAAACRLLLPFATTYLAEAGFSALTSVKNKYRNKLQDVETDLRVTLCQNFQVQFSQIIEGMQAHPSH